MAIPDGQLDSIWDELQSGSGGRTCAPDFEAEKRQAFDADLEAGRHLYSGPYLLLEAYLIRTTGEEGVAHSSLIVPSR